jgi:hypothetical protein
MKIAATIAVSLMLITALPLTHGNAASIGPAVETGSNDVPIQLEVPSLKMPAQESTVAAPVAAPLLESSAASTMFRELPSINGRYSVGRTTILPYVGAGFGNGYTSQLDRSLGGGASVQTDAGLRTPLGPTLTPNEFQMGIRIPF